MEWLAQIFLTLLDPIIFISTTLFGWLNSPFKLPDQLTFDDEVDPLQYRPWDAEPEFQNAIGKSKPNPNLKPIEEPSWLNRLLVCIIGMQVSFLLYILFAM